MQIDQSEGYESLAAAFQCVEIEALSHVLIDHGIDDPVLRRKICGNFIARSAAMLDRGWVRVEGQVVHPIVCFSRGTEPLEAVSTPTSLSVPNQGFSFEDYVSGNLFHYFEEKREDLSDLERGHV